MIIVTRDHEHLCESVVLIADIKSSEDAVSICDDHGWQRPVSNQPLYNILERHWENDVFEACHRLGLGIVNFSPLAEGTLTGKYLNGIPGDSRAADEQLGQFIQPRLNDRNLAIVRKLAEIADGLGVPLSVLALAWCLRLPVVTSTIIGASRPEQLDATVAGATLELDDDLAAQCDAVWFDLPRRPVVDGYR